MNRRLIELAERRAALATKAAIQRAELIQALAPWRGATEVVDRGLAALRFIRSHATLLTGITALIPLRRWRTAKWVQRGVMLWGVVRVIKRILHG